MSTKIIELQREKPRLWDFRPGLTKTACAHIEDSQKLEISDLGIRGIFTIRVAKTKALISCAVTAQLICAFVFA